MSKMCEECNFQGVSIEHYPCNECCEIICIGTENFPNHFEPISGICLLGSGVSSAVFCWEVWFCDKD
mgnify:CR=1 FL=1